MFKQHLFNVQDFMLMAEAGLFQDQKVELLEGIIVDMSPASPLHEHQLDSLMTRFVLALAGSALVRVEKGIDLADPYYLPHPDLAIVKVKDYHRARPQAEDIYLIIELAYSSLDSDLKNKARRYAKAAILEYWVADLASSTWHIHQKPHEGRYHIIKQLAFRQAFAPLAFPHISQVWL
ncbi:MAG: Uma2 family endonuclease [Deinococcales bacterium]